MWTNAEKEHVLILGQASHENLDRKGFDLFGLGEVLVEDVERALLRQSEHQRMWSLGRVVLVVVLLQD